MAQAPEMGKLLGKISQGSQKKTGLLQLAPTPGRYNHCKKDGQLMLKTFRCPMNFPLVSWVLGAPLYKDMVNVCIIYAAVQDFQRQLATSPSRKACDPR